MLDFFLILYQHFFFRQQYMLQKGFLSVSEWVLFYSFFTLYNFLPNEGDGEGGVQLLYIILLFAFFQIFGQYLVIFESEDCRAQVSESWICWSWLKLVRIIKFIRKNRKLRLMVKFQNQLVQEKVGYKGFFGLFKNILYFFTQIKLSVNNTTNKRRIIGGENRYICIFEVKQKLQTYKKLQQQQR
eukprot:TRINITY_DN14386_c0_g1_i1.p1 TRINITY_DN14386_c0_g1~~TRINITY_DN14386_c0_g1_i1.p1  ORF type:complete len:185 (-),score=6.54 TRINITY_DN14386_c0_g1_i1:96-650(-)